MKRNLNGSKKVILLILLAGIVLYSCKKEKKKINGFSDEIIKIISQKDIDSLRKWGMTIYEGKTPPNIEGTYYLNDLNCIFDNSQTPELGKGWSGYHYRFYDQDSKKLTVSVDSESDSGQDAASGIGSFISGNGHEFSAFFQTAGESAGISYKTVDIISGTKTNDGIINWQHCFIMTEKGSDPLNKLIEVGTSRIFTEGDKLAATASLPKKSNMKIMQSESKTDLRLANTR